jgi:hypothetical protein
VNTQNPKSKKTLAIVVITFCVLVLFVAVNYWSSALAQNQYKTLEKGNDFNPPVEISQVKSKVGLIETDKKFSANADWFKGLDLEIKNKFDKPLTHISLSVRFPRTEQGKKDFVAPIYYGESPISSQNGEFLTNTVKPIAPGESVNLKITDDYYEQIKTALSESNYPSQIQKIRVYVTVIGFEDNTIWMAGNMYQIDRDNPGKLIPLGKKKL